MRGGDKSKGQAMMTIVDAIASVCAFLLGGWLLSVSTVKILLITALSLAAAGAVIVLLTTKSEKKEASRPAALSSESD
jgi:hypothetical protein